MSEYWQLIWQAIRAGLGLGPRRDMSPEARMRRATANVLGDWWCPHCGKWIHKGDGKMMPDDFMVHKWCW